MPVIPSTIVAVTIIAAAVIIPVAPVGSVIPPVVAIPRITVIGIEGVIAGSVEGRDRNRESKDKVNTGTCRRFREERQSSDRKNEDNELLHIKRDAKNIPRIQEIVSGKPAMNSSFRSSRDFGG